MTLFSIHYCLQNEAPNSYLQTGHILVFRNKKGPHKGGQRFELLNYLVSRRFRLPYGQYLLPWPMALATARSRLPDSPPDYSAWDCSPLLSFALCAGLDRTCRFTHKVGSAGLRVSQERRNATVRRMRMRSTSACALNVSLSLLIWASSIVCRVKSFRVRFFNVPRCVCEY